MYAHLIWLTDLSEQADACRRPLRALARALHAHASVVHALGGLAGLAAEVAPRVRERAEGLSREGVPAHAVIAPGQPQHLAATWTRPDELLVVGRTGTTALERVLLGSTTRRVLDEAAADVLVVGGRPFDALARVLCPVDLAPGAPSAVARAAALARATGARVTFLHVQALHEATPSEERMLDLREVVREALGPEGQRGLDARYEVGRGESAEGAILQVAEAHDLVVMASRTRGPLARLVLGSVSDHLVRQAPVPVLVARPR